MSMKTEYGFQWVNVCTLASGAPLRIAVHEIKGAHSGPTLAIVGAQHGNEIVPLAGFNCLLTELRQCDFAGRVLMVPVANPLAFERNARCTWIDGLFGNAANLNRVWPGQEDSWLTERLANVISEHVITKADAILDFHSSTPILNIYWTYVPPQHDTVSFELGRLFGMEILVEQPAQTHGTLTQYADSLKIPCTTLEVGTFRGIRVPSKLREVPHVDIEDPTNKVLIGIKNVMQYLGMLKGNPSVPTYQILVSSQTLLGPRHGGLLVCGKDVHVGGVLPKGAILGKLINPHTFEVMEIFRAPYNWTLITSACGEFGPVQVNPGGDDFGYTLADWEKVSWIIQP